MASSRVADVFSISINLVYPCQIDVFFRLSRDYSLSEVLSDYLLGTHPVYAQQFQQ